MTSPSPLQPIDPKALNFEEKEHKSGWIARHLANSLSGRVVISAYQSLLATGTSVICLSPWGDSSPLVLPCIRFRDVAVHTVVVATGGAAVVASPLMGSAAGIALDAFGSSILVEIGVSAGYDLGLKGANDLLVSKPLSAVLPIHSARLETTSLKSLLITLQFKHIPTSASMGFFRASNHKEPSLFSNVKDYLAVQKGWFNPYLFASSRRPVIPRSMTPDIVFCHGPWLKGDYNIGETLLKESATIIALADEPEKEEELPDPSLLEKTLGVFQLKKMDATNSETSKQPVEDDKKRSGSRLPGWLQRSPKSEQAPIPEPASVDSNSTPPIAPKQDNSLTIDSLMDKFKKWKTDSKENPEKAVGDTEVIPELPQRRMVILVTGISPHRAGIWTSSARPGESVINYHLLNGCPALVVPVRTGSPLIAWHASPLQRLYEIAELEGELFDKVLQRLFEYVALCVDWDRVVIPEELKQGVEITEEIQKRTVLDALRLILAGAVRSRSSKEVKKGLDLERAGIVMFRI